jgi:hypothetical protein
MLDNNQVSVSSVVRDGDVQEIDSVIEKGNCPEFMVEYSAWVMR